MDIRQVIELLVAEGGKIGKTAMPESNYYRTASGLDFQLCRCAMSDPSYRCHEYIARNSRGTCYYVSLNPANGLVTCGPKGYHYSHPDRPECI